MSAEIIAVHLPDGAIREVPAGTTPLDIANSISPRLAAVAVVARITPIDKFVAEKFASDGQPALEVPSEAAMYSAENFAAPRLVDLSTPLTH
jgi:threonyl-tRNA synthetase